MSISRSVSHHGLVGIACVLLCGCASTTLTPPPARIDVQDAVGFTIVESGRIGSDVRLDYDEALRHLNQDDLTRGIEILESVIVAAPYLSAPRIDLAIAYRLAGNLDAAEHHLIAALESNPEHPVAHNELGIVYRTLGRFAEARQSYEAALAVYPGYHYALRNLAVLCELYLADLSCALNNYQAYLATAPGDDEASMWLSDVRYRLGGEEQ